VKRKRRKGRRAERQTPFLIRGRRKRGGEKKGGGTGGGEGRMAKL